MFEEDVTDVIREFDDYDYSWSHIFFLWVEKYILDISTDAGLSGFIFAGYQNKFCKYISDDDLRKIKQGYISEDDEDYYENVLNFKLPKLYGKMKQNLKQALVMNITLLTGMLKDAGYCIPMKIVDSFCSMERDSIFFEKKRNLKNVSRANNPEKCIGIEKNKLVQRIELEERRVNLLKEYKNLYDNGIISESEYQQKRKELLCGMDLK